MAIFCAPSENGIASLAGGVGEEGGESVIEGPPETHWLPPKLLKVRWTVGRARDRGPRFQFRKIILFGSWARGTQRADSDIDLCILLDSPVRKLDVARQIRRSLAQEIQTPLDLLIYDTREFRSRAESLKSIEREISEQGVALHG